MVYSLKIFMNGATLDRRKMGGGGEGGGKSEYVG